MAAFLLSRHLCSVGAGFKPASPSLYPTYCHFPIAQNPHPLLPSPHEGIKQRNPRLPRQHPRSQRTPQGSFCDLESHSDVKSTCKRGGQPGNQNARKHGLYSKHFTPEQFEILENADDLKDLAPEIALLRVRLNTLLDDPDTSPDLILKTLDVLSELMAVQRRYIYG